MDPKILRFLLMVDVFHAFHGLLRILKRFTLIRICSYFPTITVVLLVTAFWHPLRAVTIFSLLFFATMMGFNVTIRPLTVRSFFTGLWLWLRFLMKATEMEVKE